MFPRLFLIILLVLLGGFSAEAIAHPGAPHLHEGMSDMQGTMKMKNHKQSTEHCNLKDHSGKTFCPHKSQMRNKGTGIARDCGGFPAGRTLIFPKGNSTPLTEAEQDLQDLALNGDSVMAPSPALPPCYYGLPEPPPRSF